MKIGDLVPVNIGAGVVAQAKITEVDTENSTVTLIIPATKAVMAYSTQLAPEATAPKPEPTTETIITGVDRASGEVAPVVENTAPVETLDGVTNGPIETPKPAPNEETPTEPVKPETAQAVEVANEPSSTE